MIVIFYHKEVRILRKKLKVLWFRETRSNCFVLFFTCRFKKSPLNFERGLFAILICFSLYQCALLILLQEVYHHFVILYHHVVLMLYYRDKFE